MNEVYIWIPLLCSIFIISGVFLYLRSNTAIVSARSHILLYAFHIGIWIESIFIVLIIYSDQLSLEASEKIWIINSIVGISHFLGYFPYLLRAYRLYLVFILEGEIENYTFSKNYERTRQKWLLKALIVMLIPVIFVYIIIAVLIPFDIIGTVYNPDSDTDSTYTLIIIFIRFLEHFFLILANYFIRNVIDDFQMNVELTIVTIIYYITPLSSFYVYIFKELYWLYIARNLCLLGVTSVWPIYLSYKKSMNYQLLTVDMLASLDLILLHPNGMQAFQDFCENMGMQYANNQASLCLELFFSIECWEDSKDPRIRQIIYEKIESCETIQSNCGDLSESEYFYKIKKNSLEHLKQYYFNNFLTSQFMLDLRKKAYRHELYQIKLNNSSLQRSGEKLNFVNCDWPVKQNYAIN